ncbi:hypothetical protein HK096_004685 [Nowakowskiella sp. JEL0078]|nr:hypothetical protein HK096_004685 [Nowakowskiella sp. JEL0078]
MKLKSEISKLSTELKIFVSSSSSTLDRTEHGLMKDLFNSLFEKQTTFNNLVISHTYLEILLLIDEISGQTRNALSHSVPESLVHFKKLCDIWMRLNSEKKEPLVDILKLNFRSDPPWTSKSLNGTLDLNEEKVFLEYLNFCIKDLFSDLKNQLQNRLETVLTAMKWPQNINPITPNFKNCKKEFEIAFGDLLELKLPSTISNDKYKTRPLQPINVMLKSIALKFRFHFQQPNKPTNRLDKPEWMFSHILSVITQHSSFLRDQIQPILDDFGFYQYDAKLEFIYGLELLAMKKIISDVPLLLEDLSLLSHTISETMIFAKALRDTHGYNPLEYNPTHSSIKDSGIISIFTENEQWFQIWLDSEVDAAKLRLQELLTRPNCWDLAYESMADVDEMKCTVSCESFIILLDAVTERYKGLPNLLHRIAFFSDVQLTLLDEYLDAIRERVDRHIGTLKSSSDREQKIEGIVSLCRYLSSLNYVQSVLSDWGDQIFFLEIWKEIQDRIIHDDDDVSTTIFDEAIVSFKQKIDKISKVIVDDCEQDIVESLWRYDKK